MKARTKILIVIFVIIGAIAYLISSGFSSGSVHANLESLVGEGANYQGKYVRTEGKVVGDSIQWDAAQVELSFVIAGKTDPGVTMPVVYHNVRPDNFQDGTEVMVGGRYSPGQTFVAEELTTKCPSKYEEKGQ